MSKIPNWLGVLIGISTIIAVYMFIAWLGRLIEAANDSLPPNVVEVPPIEIPSNSGSQIELTDIQLLAAAYTVPENPLDLKIYNSLFPRILIKGSFSQAILNVKGKVGSSDAFLIFNFDNQGGIIRALRESPNRLNIPQTISRGGLFKAGSTIDISVNLLSDTLGTVGSEFIRTNLGEREFNFIEGNEPMNVIPLAVIPFTDNGGYGGVTVGELKISYLCAVGSDCGISVCENSKLYTQCIKDVYGQPAMDAWCKRTQKCTK